MVRIGIFFFLLILIFTSLIGCDGGVTIPPVITTTYTVYIRSEDVSGWVYVDGTAEEQYLYSASSITVSLTSGSHTVRIGNISYPSIYVTQNNQEFWFNSSGNWY